MMKNLVILGAGTAGTMIANRMARLLPDKEWDITVVDPETQHLYQPGLLFLPFGARDEHKMLRPRGATLSRNVEWLRTGVRALHHDNKVVELLDGKQLSYDLLVVATGTRIRPDLTPGLSGDAWHNSQFDFYTLAGALALRERLATWQGGKLVINVVEMPIKCPVAPLELAFLADAFFTDRNMRDEVEIEYVVPLDAAFTKPYAASQLQYLLDDKKIKLVTDFMTGEVDEAGKRLVSYDERVVPYDLLVTIPTHSGAQFIEDSEIGDELAFIPTDRHTLAASAMQDVFVIGDATDLPTSKAGSVAHFQADVLSENLLRASRGEALEADFDGHANCFIETGHGKAMLIDFNYEVEPLPGSFPVPGIGPFSLMKETRTNHLGKLFFRWIYWNGLLPAKPIPLSHRMSMAGKRVVPDAA